MKSIQDLAREAVFQSAKMLAHYGCVESLTVSEVAELETIKRFHALAIAQYREGLLAGVVEPIGEVRNSGAYFYNGMYTDKTDCLDGTLLYTADQMASAVLREKLRTLEDIGIMATVGATYPELMKYLQAEIEAIRNTK